MIDPQAVVGGMMLFGLLLCIPWAAIDGVPAGLHGKAWLWLFLAGGGNVAGLVLAYYAFRRGTVSLVVPVISTEGSVAAVIAIVAGESLGLGTAVALLLAAIGVCATSVPAEGSTEDGGLRHHVITVALAFAAALIFGLGLYATGRAGALLPAAWVVPAARAVGTVTIALPLALRGRLKITREAAPFVAGSGACEVLGFIAYTIGTRHGLAIAAVLASQFAAISVLFAYFFFKERMSRLQVAGICTIIVGVSLLSIFNS